jgi:hypothetical protein
VPVSTKASARSGLADHAPRYRVERSTPASRLGTVAALLLLALFAGLPLWAERGTMRLLVEFFYYACLASLWNLLAGYAGLVSVGQQAFVGLGGYTLFAAAIFLGAGPVLALPLAAVIAATFAPSRSDAERQPRSRQPLLATWRERRRRDMVSVPDGRTRPLHRVVDRGRFEEGGVRGHG